MALVGERFELGARIGRGAAGDVHRAVDTATGEVVAVKLVDLEEAEDEAGDGGVQPMRPLNVRRASQQSQEHSPNILSRTVGGVPALLFRDPVSLPLAVRATLCSE
jgi:serine/threonine protein kinase